MRRSVWAVLFFWCGCPRPPPPPPRPSLPPPIQIPAGCEARLTGEWRHEEDATFRYHFEDDGSEVTVWVYRVFPPLDAGLPSRLFPRPPRDAGSAAADAGPVRDGPDGGTAASAAAQPDAGTPTHHHLLPADLLPLDGGTPPLATAVIHLSRTPNGFLGEAETLHLLPSGRECRAAFSTRIAACAPSSLTLVSATSTPMGEGCQTPALPRPAALLEHRLARMDGGEL